MNLKVAVVLLVIFTLNIGKNVVEVVAVSMEVPVTVAFFLEPPQV
jgi:hypothetical protein